MRMYPLSETFPTPLLPVAGVPVIDYLVEHLLRCSGVQRIHLVPNHRFIAYFEQWRAARACPLPLVLHDDGSTANDNRRGALADLMLALRAEKAPCPVIAAAGDNIFRFDLAAMWRVFLTGADHCVVALHEPDTDKLRRTGVLELAGGDVVTRLHEKPAQPPTQSACPPLYFFQPDAWRWLEEFLADPRNNRDAPGYFIDYLCRRACVRALHTQGTRLDIGSIESYRAADAALQQRKEAP